MPQLRVDFGDKAGMLERLRSHTIYSNTSDCWIWAGAIAGCGYGVTSFSGKLYGVHRISAYLFLGLCLQDRSQQANHKSICKRRDCWNPEHLYVGTQLDNGRDIVVSNDASGSFKCGHPRTEENTWVSPTIRKGHTSPDRHCRCCHRYRAEACREKLKWVVDSRK